ncbi:hypothetical protein FEZ32_07455 [Acidipropionibacterium jensenii]|uniref:hypothetical protein n=1 Tax=Acidipropionibacterium jensenii TaxID=1749 RepID=UPI00110A9FE0|nr:hypothetical protein [Acidipropionibacterium jensenii]QCV88211.1 hypothetical protein FEZ32_07455 [Acidipropionibacterium jensenii]
MNSIPTASNGGLLLYVAVALLLVWLAAVSRPSRRVAIDTGPHKSNPVSVGILPDEDAAGAITTTLQSQGVVMSHPTSTRIPTDRLVEAAADLRPWWASGGHHVLNNSDRPTDDDPEAGWVRWLSAPMCDDPHFDAWLERTVSIDDDLQVLAVTDEIAATVEDREVAFPVARASDAIALIRAAVSVWASHPTEEGLS